MTGFRFVINSVDKKCRARNGIIHTKNGQVRTPAFVPVATSASVKSLTTFEVKSCLIDVFFVNTYHMIFRPGISTVKKAGGLHKFMNWDGPIMTDSAGFQVFSLSQFGPRQVKKNEPQPLVKIRNNGIFFKSVWDGKEIFLSPEESVKAQQTLDSDIMMAFDECTFYPITKKRAYTAMDRTHLWALSSIRQHHKNKNNRALYGIVQGSVFEDLRKQSAKYICRLDFEGLAIGGVANSREPREKKFSVLEWTMPILYPTEKPIHFLGIGEIEDIFLSIEKGVDSLDCITPTRLGRMGWVFTRWAGLKNKFRYDIQKRIYSQDINPPDKLCSCFTCKEFSRAYLHHLFRTKELLAYRLASLHNLYFFGKLMEDIREAIADNKFMTLKKKWLGY